MNEWQWFSGLAAALVYAVVIVRKVSAVRKTELSLSGKTTLRSVVSFDTVRLFLDGTVLVLFLLSNLCPAWFGLFRGTALGYCTGCVILISITLLISVFVDWIPVRNHFRQFSGEVPSFSRFLLRQFVRIFQIEFVLAIIWCVFLLLEPVRMHFLFRIFISVAVLLLYRGLLSLARKFGEK